MLDLTSHQDYANWELTGKRYYITNDNHDLKHDELEEVISVDNVKCVCETCGKETPVLKPICNTPGFHHDNNGICYPCEENYIITTDGTTMITEEEYLKL